MTTDRITAPKVMGILDDHIKLHENKLDPKVHQHHVLLLGPDGDDGLCSFIKEMDKDMKEVKKRIDKYDENVSRILWLVGGTFIAAVLNIILKITG